jgi:hypothetical protein
MYACIYIYIYLLCRKEQELHFVEKAREKASLEHSTIYLASIIQVMMHGATVRHFFDPTANKHFT